MKVFSIGLAGYALVTLDHQVFREFVQIQGGTNF
jgi:hypothetical protein